MRRENTKLELSLNFHYLCSYCLSWLIHLCWLIYLFLPLFYDIFFPSFYKCVLSCMSSLNLPFQPSPFANNSQMGMYRPDFFPKAHIFMGLPRQSTSLPTPLLWFKASWPSRLTSCPPPLLSLLP